MSQSDGCAVEFEWECTEWSRHHTQGVEQSQKHQCHSVSETKTQVLPYQVGVTRKCKQFLRTYTRGVGVSNTVTWISPVSCSLTLMGLVADLKGKVGEMGPGSNWLVGVAQDRGKNDGPSVSLPLGISTLGIHWKEGGRWERESKGIRKESQKERRTVGRKKGKANSRKGREGDGVEGR